MWGWGSHGTPNFVYESPGPSAYPQRPTTSFVIRGPAPPVLPSPATTLRRSTWPVTPSSLDRLPIPSIHKRHCTTNPISTLLPYPPTTPHPLTTPRVASLSRHYFPPLTVSEHLLPFFRRDIGTVRPSRSKPPNSSLYSPNTRTPSPKVTSPS